MSEYMVYALKRVVIGVVIVAAVIWISGSLMGMFGNGNEKHAAALPPAGETAHAESDNAGGHADAGSGDSTHAVQKATQEQGSTAAHGESAAQAAPAAPVPAKAHPPVAADSHATPATGSDSHAAVAVHYPVKGMAFVNALIKPMDYELNERFWGWRPNDIVTFTDNVNNFQLGVLEVTRRSAMMITERVSRTGSTASFDRNLENAMSWFMIKADRFWFPAAETKFNAGLAELRTYFDRLGRGEATFYTRTDNLIPLLSAYEDLLGSCDENLVKNHEKDGSEVSYFKADNYFYYAQGVASAMLTILEAIAHDFEVILESRRGTDMLHHAIESCHHATEIRPILVTNNSLSSVFANHRANMAAPISHARFYIGVLIKALST